MKSINIRDLFDGDWAVAVKRAIASAGNKDSTIKFPAGEYEFFPENADTKFACISNHEGDGIRPFAFPLTGSQNLTISGEEGTSFLFNGCMIPILIRKSQNIKLENLSIDWKTPFYSQGIIRRVEKDILDLEICNGYEGSVKNGQLMLRGQPFWGAAEMDVENRRIKPGKALNFQEDHPEKLHTEKLTPRTFRIHGKLRQPPDAGSLIVLRHGRRNTPAIFIDTSHNTNISGITIHHAGGMGIIAQNSNNLTITGFTVKITPNTERMFSTCADALHIVNSTGEITIKDTILENQFDDALNIHGIYTIISKWNTPSAVKAKLAHRSQKGLCIGRAGDRIRLCERSTLKPLEEATIKKIEQIDIEYTAIKFDKNLTTAGEPNLALENLTLRPSRVVIKNCTAKNNNPRGLLITTGGRVLITNNHISTPGAAIRISGDAGSWYESGPVETVEIKNNQFEHCNYGNNTSSSVIDIVPELERHVKNFHYHKKITITDNTFKNCCTKILHGWSAEQITFKRNRILGVPPGMAADDLFDLKHCGTVCFDSNYVDGERLLAPVKDLQSGLR